MMHPQQIHPEQIVLNYPGRMRLFNNIGSTSYIPPNPLPQTRNKVAYPPNYLRPQTNCPQIVPKHILKHYPNAVPPPTRRTDQHPGPERNRKHHVNNAQNEQIKEVIPRKTIRDSEIISTPADNSRDNEKLKTPMCLVNELARYNKIAHQYRLTGEAGPAHKKKFTVTLKLGEEEYTADGASIKKAQHIAAGEAMQKTRYNHPPPKLKHLSLKATKKSPGNITPTVELNAFAMKHNLSVTYTPITTEPVSSLDDESQICANADDSNKNNLSTPNSNKVDTRQRISGDHIVQKVSVKVGQRTFVGIGVTPQAARHNAAARALEILKTVKTDEDDDTLNTSDKSTTINDLKSPISLVHEIALKRKLTVTFDVKLEKGPPHMKIFVTQCKVGDVVTEGEGNGKKISRKKAAENMLQELRQNGPIASSSTSENSQAKNKKKITSMKKKNRNLIKENITETSPEDVNPISRLIQLSQAKKEKEPVYSLVEERGAPRRREFVIEASFSGVSANGSGPNKKVAKRNAAIGLLNKLGISGIEMKETNENIEETKNSNPTPVIENKDNNNKTEDTTPPKSKKTESTVSQETSSDSHSSLNDMGLSNLVKPKQQLLYLAQILDFQVQFSDFPKGNHGEYLTLVTLSTFPPQLCHGSGPTIEESADAASVKALSLLRELGLDIVKKPGSC